MAQVGIAERHPADDVTIGGDTEMLVNDIRIAGDRGLRDGRHSEALRRGH
jgi:hypothetical protein